MTIGVKSSSLSYESRWVFGGISGKEEGFPFVIRLKILVSNKVPWSVSSLLCTNKIVVVNLNGLKLEINLP